MHVSRRSASFAVALGSLLPVLGLAGNPSSPGPRPNLLFLLADDLRADALHATGNHDVHTPNLDRLAREGCVFTRAAIQGGTVPAVCAPSRAALLSGRSIFRFPPADLHRLTNDVPLLPAVLRSNGYRDYAVGKWHNGGAWLSRAFSDGDKLFLGGMGHHAALPVHPFRADGKYPATGAETLTRHASEVFADAAIEFLRRPDDGRPFFLYVAFTAPHDPRESPTGYVDRYPADRLRLPANFLPEHPFDNGEMSIRDEKLLPWPRTATAVRRELRDYYGAITHLDEQVGRILAALRSTGHERDTLVVFTADNGLALGSHGLLGKQNCYEHSLTVPLIIRGPGVPAGRRSPALVQLQDLFPTLCELSRIAVPGGLDGRSFAPVIRGERRDHREALLGAYGSVQRSIREDRWKLIRYPRLNRSQLFDLRRDPHERSDLADDPRQAARVATLLERLAELQRLNGDTLPLGAREEADLRLLSHEPAPLPVPLPTRVSRGEGIPTR